MSKQRKLEESVRSLRPADRAELAERAMALGIPTTAYLSTSEGRALRFKQELRRLGATVLRAVTIRR